MSISRGSRDEDAPRTPPSKKFFEGSWRGLWSNPGFGIQVIGGDLPQSAAYRDGVRASLVQLAANGRLEVPMSVTYRLEQALEAVGLVRGRYPGGKVALVPAPTGTPESAGVTPSTG